MDFNLINVDYDVHNTSLNNTSNKSLRVSTNSSSVNLFNNSSFGYLVSVLEWQSVTSILVLLTVILSTIFGNILVILGVFTYKPLRKVQNFFIVSLAAADLAVAMLVMPLNVAYMIVGRWLWGKELCKMWLTCDIMSCTSSILNLCAIALDRYWAITDPIKYANKRTLKRVTCQIVAVWILSLIISSPPLLGWNDWPDEFTTDTPCQLTSEPGYVAYSSLGSFFIPLIIMIVVYSEIYIAARKRLRKRVLVTRIENKKPVVVIKNQEESHENRDEFENESDSGDSIKPCPRRAFMDMKRNLFVPLLILNDSVSQLAIESQINQTQVSISSSNNRTYKLDTVGSLKHLNLGQKKQNKLLLGKSNKSIDIVHQFIEQKQKISLTKERRAARTLGVIMGVFVVCWLPFFLLYLILPFCSTWCPSIGIINIITWLGYTNSTVNPLIYTIFNIEFRRAFKKLLGIK